MRSAIRSIVFLLVVVFLLPACSTVNRGHRHESPPREVHRSQPGPPDHAPAHGYRRKHSSDNVEMVYDAPSGVYIVAGHADHFFSGDRYYRTSGENWEISPGIGGPWKVTNESSIPQGLKSKKPKKSKQKNKGRNNTE